MARTARLPALVTLTAATRLPVAAEIALRVAVVLTRWSERRRSRIALSRLDDRLLGDVGLNPRCAFEEQRRPFWQG